MRKLLFAAALACLAGPAMAREITGTVTYLSRMALPDAATLAVEARGWRGVVVAESRETTAGRQVPIPFSITVPEGIAVRLRAAIFMGDAPRFVGEPVDIPAGRGDVALGELVLPAFDPLAFPTTLDCGGRKVRFGIAGDRAAMEVGEERFPLTQVPAASGSRYEAPDEPGTFLWDRAGRALVSVRGDELPDCVAVPEDSPFRAGGNEPFWSLSVEDGQVTITRMGEDTATVVPLPAPEIEEGAYLFDLRPEGPVMRIEERVCRDSMTGMPHPVAVTLSTAEGSVEGCGGDPAELLAGGAWVVGELAGDVVPEGAGITMTFDAGTARVAGRGGCNRYGGGFELTGEGLRFGEIAATMMACPEPAMARERRFFDALGAVIRFDIAESGALMLYGAEGDALITARR